MTAAARERPYHHGNLRPVLLAAALDELETVGASRLSLREVARRAGVSHAAPRHHFGDKRGLLTAVAADGYRRLADVTGAAARSGGSLDDVGLSYVRFALAHPGHFAVMFRPELYDTEQPELISERDRAASVLLASVSTGLPPDAVDAEALAAVVAAWSLTHGFATLWVTGNLTFTGAPDPEVLAAAAFAVLRRLVGGARP